MKQTTYRVVLTLAVLLGLFAVPAFAADRGGEDAPAATTKEESNYLKPLIAIGAGIITIGGAMGIGKLATAAMEGTARQPEAGGQIRTSMIIAAALIEGFTFFALIVCMIL